LIYTNCLAKYNGMTKCLGDNWTDQKEGCSFAVKSRTREVCQHYGENNACDCVEAQKMAYNEHGGAR